jgi:acyl-CoA dehydrogenase
VIDGKIKICFAQTEPDAGSDPAGMKTRAVRDGDHYIVNGTKRFITGAKNADYAQVIAVTDPEKGARGGVSCFMVSMKAPGVTLERLWPTMMGDTPGQIHFENVRVAAVDMIGGEGPAAGQPPGDSIHDRRFGNGVARLPADGLRVRVAARPWRRHSSAFLHDQDSVRRNGGPGR